MMCELEDKYKRAAMSALKNPSDDNITSVAIAEAFLIHDPDATTSIDKLLDDAFIECVSDMGLVEKLPINVEYIM